MLLAAMSSPSPKLGRWSPSTPSPSTPSVGLTYIVNRPDRRDAKGEYRSTADIGNREVTPRNNVHPNQELRFWPQVVRPGDSDVRNGDAIGEQDVNEERFRHRLAPDITGLNNSCGLQLAFVDYGLRNAAMRSPRVPDSLKHLERRPLVSRKGLRIISRTSAAVRPQDGCTTICLESETGKLGGGTVHLWKETREWNV